MIPSFLAGEASLWWDAREIEVTEGRVPALANWAAFETELKQEFEPQDYTFEIRTKLQMHNIQTMTENAPDDDDDH
jgi:hypothetical protein